MTVADLEGEPLVLPRRGTPAGRFRSVVEHLCAQAGFSPRVAYELDDLPAVQAFVAAGIAIVRWSSFDAELCLCAMTRLEILYSARSTADFTALEEELALFRDLRMDAETFAVARTGQRQLARAGRHRVALPDLLIAACAQQHSAGVLHVDRRYDLLAGVFAFEAVRLG